jgi:hypothetical protein
MEVSGQLHDPAALPPVRVRTLGGPHSRSGRCQESYPGSAARSYSETSRIQARKIKQRDSSVLFCNEKPKIRCTVACDIEGNNTQPDFAVFKCTKIYTTVFSVVALCRWLLQFKSNLLPPSSG